MKKSLSIILCLALMLGAIAVLSSCNETKTYEIAIVTDVGLLMDKGFNQGTYEGAKAYAEKHNIAYKYYQPANGSDASDNDRIDAMKQAISNGAKIIVAPGFLQATAMETVSKDHPEVKFV
ncbi:MAG: BMP family ABC transporter substrate-binding protein, partial [Clostridia bacterium]|nr:BMP family ABC transporter substrate-binding protein [Clostridia bacterium]